MNRAAEPYSIKALLEQATRTLARAANSTSARLDAEVLLGHVLQQPRSHLHAWPEKTVPPETREQFRQLLARRAAGEPVAYLGGKREFWSLPLVVSTDTLIPRPETELLVEQALLRIPGNTPLRIADLGTGSGAIALAIAHERPDCRIVATDINSGALEVARDNARRLRLDNVRFRNGDWYEPLAGIQFDMILSNPPYIADSDPHLQQGDVRFEPRGALAAGPQGMDALTQIAHAAGDYLVPGGWLLLEHGCDQAERVQQLLEDTAFTEVINYFDMAGLARVSAGRLPAV